MKKTWACWGARKVALLVVTAPSWSFSHPLDHILTAFIVAIRGERWETPNFTGHGFPEAGLLCGL